MRAAASSIASGIPWSRAEIPATAGALALVTAKPGRTDDRPRDEQAHGLELGEGRRGRGRAAPRGRFSRSTSDRSAEVGWCGQARDRVLLLAGDAERDAGRDERSAGSGSGGAARRRPCRRRPPARSCRGRAGRAQSPMSSTSRSMAVRALLSASPRVRAIVGATRAGSRTASRATNQTPSGKSSAAAAATWSDSRVLPVPPGPVRVRSRVVRSSPTASPSSRSRPTNVVSWVGRLFGRASSERSGGKVSGSPSMTSWPGRSGSRRSLSRWRPRSRRPTPSGRASATSARVASLSRTWPPWATAAIRAVRLMS